MTNDLIYAISNALDKEFKEFGYEIHMEEIKQGLKEPCFFINLINSDFKIVTGKRYEKRNQISIQYFPESLCLQSECNEVAERLTLCLEYIEDEEGGFLHGTDMHYQVTDGILNFFVNYNFHVLKTEAEPERMHDLTMKSELKE